jgi:hypothetical protein
MTKTQGDPQAGQLLRLLHEFKSPSFRIDVGPFTTLLRRWEWVMGHANGSFRKNRACTMSQLQHDNAPSHTSVLTQQFLAKYKIALITHPPHSPDLAPCDFFLFSKMKLKLN